MAREILFRGKRIDNGEWAYGYYGKTQRKCTSPHAPIMFDEHWIIEEIVTEDFSHFRDVGVIADTVGLWTGLTDKNGMKMFEHDKLKDNKGQIGTIFYSETAAAFLVNWKMKDGSFETDACFYGEVIGNIHEEVTE